MTSPLIALLSARGIPLVFHLTPGEAADCTAFEEVIALAEERPAYLLADKGYDSDAIRASLHEAGIRSCIPPKSNRKAKIRWNRRMYRERNRIGRMIGHLKINRAIATRMTSSPVPSSTRFILPLSADAYAMQRCKLGLALNCAGRLQSIRAKTCSRAAKNCCHQPLAPW